MGRNLAGDLRRQSESASSSKPLIATRPSPVRSIVPPPPEGKQRRGLHRPTQGFVQEHPLGRLKRGGQNRAPGRQAGQEVRQLRAARQQSHPSDGGAINQPSQTS